MHPPGGRTRSGLRVVVARLVPGVQELDRHAAHYVAHVHRLRAGDRFVAVLPSEGLEAAAEVISTRDRVVRVAIGAVERAASPARLPAITLIQAIGKGSKPDQVIRDATALGVARVVLVETRRTIVAVGDRAPSRRERWERIAAEAARQCGRADLPEIEGPLAFVAALESAPSAVRLCLVPQAERSLVAALAADAGCRGVALLVGPEGGLENAEIEAAQGAGFAAVRIAPFVLRTETAATAALGAVVAHLDGRIAFPPGSGNLQAEDRARASVDDESDRS